jgi:hypothetical protein
MGNFFDCLLTPSEKQGLVLPSPVLFIYLPEILSGFELLN